MIRAVIIGAGGHARVVLDAARVCGEFDVEAAVDLPNRVGGEFHGVPIAAAEDGLEALRAGGAEAAIIAVGSVGDTAVRERLAAAALAAGFSLATVVHPSATVAASAQIGEGTFVAAGAVIAPEAVVGRCAIINHRAVVDHDCEVGDFAHLSPGCTLSGTVRIGDRSHLGTASCVVQGVRIAEDALIGAGSVVIDDVPARVVAYGNPCRIVRNRS